MAGDSVLREDDNLNGDQALFKINNTFKKIFAATDKLNPMIKAVQEANQKFPSFQSDLENIHLAGERLTYRVCEQCMQMGEKIELSEEALKQIRHDLRAQVGTVLGFSELVLEDLTYLENEETLIYAQLLNMIIESSKSIIPMIDLLRLDDSVEERCDIEASCIDIISRENQFPEATILVIDDSAYNRDILTRRLKRYKANVVSAENGASGLELAFKTSVDLILLDIMMPVMNGYEVLVRLKGNEKTKNIPVLMISALSEIESIVRCINVGAEDYLPTPFNPAVLHARIKTCLEKKMLLDRAQENTQRLEQSRQLLETAIESIDDGFAIFGPDSRLIMSNKEFQELYPAVEVLGLTGFTHSEFLRENYNLGIFFEERRATHHFDEPENREDWIRLYESRDKSLEPYLMRLKDGRWIEVVNNLTPDRGYVSVHKDVTDQKKDEERLTFLALHDPLTGLANRSAFETQLHSSFESFIGSHNFFALMYLDLDGFKNVNDTFGHDVGDELLIQVAKTLQHCVRAEDFIARMGGDEFAILFRESITADELKVVAIRILNDIGHEFVYEEKKIDIGISIGIAIYPDDGRTQEAFISNADAAMYAAKKAGKHQFKMARDLVR